MCLLLLLLLLFIIIIIIIRKLSDINKDGQLNFDEFIIAMKLVLMRRKGHDIPSILPEVLSMLMINMF